MMYYIEYVFLRKHFEGGLCAYQAGMREHCQMLLTRYFVSSFPECPENLVLHRGLRVCVYRSHA